MNRKRQHDLKPDFNAATLLRKNLESQSRPRLWGITIDPANARVLDDGIFIARLEKGWKVDVSIADVPAMIPDRSELEFQARRQGYEKRGPNGKVERIFPHGFLLNYVSLQEGAERPAVTFSIILDENLEIRKYDISRTIFLNKKQCNDNDIIKELEQKNPDVEAWVELARNLHQKNQDEIAAKCESLVAEGDKITAGKGNAPLGHKSNPADLLVHEMMNLANQAASRYLLSSRVPAPLRAARGEVNAARVTKDLAFDRECNMLAWDMVCRINRHTLPSLHVTSPMREYKHFLALKIIGRQLDGLGPDESLTRQSGKITAYFNELAKAARPDILEESWEQQWSRQRTRQNQRPIPAESGGSYAMLRALCQDNGWKMPLWAERVLLINGTEVAMAILKCTVTGSHQSWAVSADPTVAIETAAARMTAKLKEAYTGLNKVNLPKPDNHP